MLKSKAPPRFSVGDLVRVKPGVRDPDFADIPLGGWAGKVAEIGEGSPLIYLIRWNQPTLKQADPVYRKRCERDGLEFEQMWLGENDLGPDTGGPVAIEQPASVATKPLSPKDQDDRVRMAFGLTSDDPLPTVNADTLAAYHKYLAADMDFPFDAEYSFHPRPLETTTCRIRVLGVLDPEEVPADEHGLFCQARRDREVIELPLAKVEVREKTPNRQLIRDYSYWFGNWS